MKIIRLSSAILLGLTLASSTVSIGFGAPDHSDASKYDRMIQILKTTDHVLIYVVAPNVFFRGHLNEDGLRRVACKYEPSNLGNGRSVLENILLSTAAMVSTEDRHFDFRVGLEIGDQNMFIENVKFAALDKEMRIAGRLQGLPFFAPARLVDDIRRAVKTRDFDRVGDSDNHFCDR